MFILSSFPQYSDTVQEWYSSVASTVPSQMRNEARMSMLLSYRCMHAVWSLRSLAMLCLTVVADGPMCGRLTTQGGVLSWYGPPAMLPKGQVHRPWEALASRGAQCIVGFATILPEAVQPLVEAASQTCVEREQVEDAPPRRAGTCLSLKCVAHLCRHAKHSAPPAMPRRSGAWASASRLQA